MDDERKYNPIEDKAQHDMRPGFLGGGGGGEAPSGSRAESKASERAAANDSAADSLKSAENKASGGLYNRGGGLDEAKADESRAGGFYSGGQDGSQQGGLAGKISAIKDFKRGNFTAAFKKAGPILSIFFVIIGVGILMASTQLFQPFSIVAQIQESFNSMHPSAYSRSANIIRRQLDGSTKRFTLSEKQKANFEQHGIKYNDQFDGPDGNKIRVLEYDTDGGQHRIITADADTAAKLRANGVMALSIDAAESDTTFNRKFTAASQTWRGQFANWFGGRTNEFLKNNKMTRNLWKDYKQKASEAEASGKSRLEVIKEMIGNKVNGGEGGGVSRREGVTDDDGNRQSTGSTSSEGNSKVDAQNITSKLDSIKSKISGGANVGCAVVDFIGIVSLMVAAQEASQIIGITTSYMEAVDKTKAGHGDEAPINEIAHTLNDQTKADHEILVSGDGGGASDNGNYMAINAKSESVEGKTKSAMQSAGMAALFGNGIADPSDPSVQSFNLTSSANTILGGLGIGVGAFQACTVGRAAAAVASIGMDVAGCLLSACLGTIIKGVAIGATMGLAIAGVITMITPWLTNTLERDLVSSLAGEDLGNAIVSGGNMYQGFVHKSNGGSLATERKYRDFAIVQTQVIAKEAQQERTTLSPFDMTSKNSFMGSLMHQLMTLNTSSSLMSTLTSASSVISSSMTSLSPSTSAVASEIAENIPNMSTYEQTCPYLASIGAIGDSFCNPYTVTDFNTIEMNPDDVIQTVDNLGGLSNVGDGGNVTIDKNSDLMNYIVYCGDRTSAFGVADQSIASNFKSSTGNPTLDTVVGSAPIMGDLMDIYDAGAVQSHIGYISGESCVATDNEYADLGSGAANWSTAKYYQRFIEDQSLAESMGIIEKSAVAVALEDYYKENPLDESYEGQLARWSGLDKETVTDLLDVIAYYDYINNYDPSDRYAFGAPVVDESVKPLDFKNNMVMDSMTVALEGIVYQDIRNRNYAV